MTGLVPETENLEFQDRTDPMTNNSQVADRKRQIPSKPINPVGSLLNHLPAVALIVILVLLLGSGAVLVKVKPFFSTEAVIKIEPVAPKILYGKEEASIMPYYDDFVRTQINIVKSFPVISRVIKLSQEKDLKWQMPGETVE